MSQELIDFSEQIDEQFDIADMESVESDDLLEAILNLFIWSVCVILHHLSKMNAIVLPWAAPDRSKMLVTQETPRILRAVG